MKILAAADVFFPDAPGGAARVPWEIARGLAARGHRVALFARNVRGGPALDSRENVTILRHPWRTCGPIRLWNDIRSVLSGLDFHPDVIHVHSPLAGLFLEAERRLASVPRVHFFHSPWAEEYLLRREFVSGAAGLGARLLAGLRDAVERRELSKARRVVTLSGFMEARLTARHGPPPGGVARIPGAADTARFRPLHSVAEARVCLKWPLDRPTFVTVRNLEARMGLENLLGAMPGLLSKEPRLGLVIVGRGSLERFLRDEVRRLRLEEAVTFLGVVPDEILPLCYQAADAFVLPTRALEGFGLVTVEALASGCPVVATPVGATPEILAPLDPGFLAAGASSEHLREALARFLDRRAAWPSLREKCARHAAENFSWDRAVSDVLRLSESLLGRDPS